MKEKFIPCAKGNGPDFGDIVVSDECNKNQDSFVDIPLNYSRAGANKFTEVDD